MTTTGEAESTVDDLQKRGSTTIRLEKRDDVQWFATQGGVPVEGRGESAAEAAAEYCRKVESMDG